MIQLQRKEHDEQQERLINKYNISMESNQLKINHLKQYQILEIQHIYEQFNMQLEQVLIFNQYEYNYLIECQQFEQNQLKYYQNLEIKLMFKKNKIINQLTKLNIEQYYYKYYNEDLQLKLYQKLNQINFQKREVNKNITLFFQKKI